MKVAIASICSPEYSALADVTTPPWKSYCERHGYFDFTRLAPCGARGLAWQKIDVIAGLLQNHDLVLWSGADVLLTNPALCVEDQWVNEGSPAAVLTADVYGINSDVMLFHHTPAAEMFLYAVRTLGWDFYQSHRWAEQEAIIRLAERMPYAEHLKVIPQKSWNSYLHAEYGRPASWPGQWEPGDWMLHMPGLSLERRIELAELYKGT